MKFDLPKTVNIGETPHAIRYDFRVILEIITMLSDVELNGEEKTDGILEMFYLDPDSISYRERNEAVEACFTFIDGGKQHNRKKQPRLTDWEQDFEFIIAPVNRVLGYESRAVDYDPEKNSGGVHWWTFLAAYMEIGGECTYSQIVTIRDKQARNKKLEKHEKEWLRRNGDIVKLKSRYTEEENEFLKQWGGGKNG